MTLYLESVDDDCLHPVVVAVHLDAVDHAGLACLGGDLGEHLVVVARDLKMTNCIPGADLYLAIVASEDAVICGLHQGHTDRVIGNID